MKTSVLVISIITLLSTTACNNESTENKDPGYAAETIETSEFDNEIDKDLEGLTLNNGQKWKADRSTDDGMKTVQQMLNNFDGENTEQLGADIKDSLNTVIKECDFKGEDHNQFHIILHAMIKESKQLKKGNTIDLAKMQAYIDAYNEHFEVGKLK